jgi:hypothetical protein
MGPARMLRMGSQMLRLEGLAVQVACDGRMPTLKEQDIVPVRTGSGMRSRS